MYGIPCWSCKTGNIRFSRIKHFGEVTVEVQISSGWGRTKEFDLFNDAEEGGREIDFSLDLTRRRGEKGFLLLIPVEKLPEEEEEDVDDKGVRDIEDSRTTLEVGGLEIRGYDIGLACNLKLFCLLLQKIASGERLTPGFSLLSSKNLTAKGSSKG